MINLKKKSSIADQVNEALKPKKLTEEAHENEAKFETFDEYQENNQISEIRKQNVKNLGEIDSKYKGKVVSRKEIEADHEDFPESESDLLSENELEQKSGSDREDENESEYGSENSGDISEQDFDISHFLQTSNKPSTSSANDHNEKTKLVNKPSTSEDVKRGICVQNQLKMWEKLLEVRIKAQKMLITANSLPDFDAFLELSEQEGTEFMTKVDGACDRVFNLLDNLLELQSTLVEQFSESKNVLNDRKRKSDGSGSFMMKKSKLSDYADKIENNYEAYSSFRNQVLQKWHDRTKNLKDSKNPVTNLNVLTKIENALLGKNEVIKKSQIYRGDFEIFGLDPPKDDQVVLIPEIYDDSEFYHQLLRELIEYKSNFGDNQSEITYKFIELQNIRSKMKKRVETRTSKGRKIRYNVHNKLVNFMAPKDESEWTDEAKTELFNSLFGISNKTTIS